MYIYQLGFFLQIKWNIESHKKIMLLNSKSTSKHYIRYSRLSFIYLFCIKVWLHRVKLFVLQFLLQLVFLLPFCTSHQSAKDLTGQNPQISCYLLELIPAHLALSTSVSLSLLHLQGAIHVYSLLHNKIHTLTSTKSP